MDYTMTKPCPKCPFRNDIRAYLTPERVDEIDDSLVNGEFPCHQTMDYDAEEGEPQETSKTRHCAGALILLEKLERPSQMMRICERIRLYDASKLDMSSPVFEDFDEMRDAQPEYRHRRAR